jgi:GNAT superfamily N-acetyltransferase
MRGQRLFIRPIDASDHDLVRSFLDRNGNRSAVPGCGLIGKLVGELVAVVAMDITDDGLRVDDIVVAEELRRKRIGRVMLDEVEQLAAKIGRTKIVVERAGEAREFFHRIGFVGEGERMTRNVGAHGARR